MIIPNFKYEGSSLPGVICNIVVKAHFSRPTPQMHHGIYMMGYIWQTFWILQEKVGNFFYFWIIRLVNSQCCTVMSDVTPSTPNKTLESPQMTPKWQRQISTMRVHICQESYVILLWKVIMADLPLQMHQGIYIMGCIWQPFWNLQVKVGISFISE